MKAQKSLVLLTGTAMMEAQDNQKIELNTYLVQHLLYRLEQLTGKELLTEKDITDNCLFHHTATVIGHQSDIVDTVLEVYRAHYPVNNTWREPTYKRDHVCSILRFYGDVVQKDLVRAKWAEWAPDYDPREETGDDDLPF